MALMKTGRKPNGEDPKKPKAQGEVKVTAKKPVEPPQKQYTWEDVERNEAAKSKNKAAKEKYESDVASYNKAMKLYKEGPESIQETSPDGFTATNRKNNSLSAEKMNKDISEKLKKGELVPINDPSLDPETRKIISEKFKGFKDVFGDVSDRYISKGTKYSGDKSSIKIYETYRTPEQPKAPTYENEENIDIKKIPIPKMRQLKSDEKKTYGKLAEYKAPAPAEKPDWEAPEGSIKYRTKYKTMRTQGRGNETVKGKIKNFGAFAKAKFEAIGKENALTPGLVKTQGKERLIQGKSGREAKMAKAYFSGYEGKSKFDIEGTSEERGAIGKLKADKASLKEGIKEIRRGKDSPSPLDKSDRIAGLRAAKKDVKAEIKQAKLASKYVSKLGQEYTGVREGQDLRSTGKIKTFTPTAMAGFSGSKQDTFDPEANFKSQLNNPANRNTIAAQEKSLSFKERLASEKEARQKAPSFKERRAQRKADIELQKSIKIPGK